MSHLNDSTMHSVIVDMIHESLEIIQRDEKIDKDKLDILSGLVFEHIFHRTHTFVSDELNEFREHTPKLKKHQEYIEWSIPIINSSDKIIRKLKQIGVVFSILFTLTVIGSQLFSVIKNYVDVDISVTKKHIIHYNEQNETNQLESTEHEIPIQN